MDGFSKNLFGNNSISDCSDGGIAVEIKRQLKEFLFQEISGANLDQE